MKIVAEYKVFFLKFPSHTKAIVIEKKKLRRAILAIIKYIILTTLGIVLFSVASDYAKAVRGYDAVGGEYFLLLLPVVWAVCESVVRGTIKSIKEDYNSETED